MAEFYNVPQYSNPMINDFTQSIDQQVPADQTELQRALAAREQMLADRQRQTQVQQGLIDENQILASPRTAQGGLQRAGGDVLGAQALVAQDVGRKPWEALFPAPPIGRTPQELNLQQTQIPGGQGNLLQLKEALTAGKGLNPEGMAAIGRGLGMDIPNPVIEAARQRALAAREGQSNRERAALDKVDLSQWFDKDTGEPAGAGVVGSQEQLHNKFMRLNTLQKQDNQNLPQLIDLTRQYDRIGKAMKDAGLVADEGIGSSYSTAAKIKLLRQGSNALVGDLDSTNARIQQIAAALGQDKRVSETELKMLKAAVIQDGDSAGTIKSKLDNMKNFLAVRVKSSGLPWVQKELQGQGQAPANPAQQQQAPQAALDYLKANPGASAQFQAKYGYLP